jgi:hypothetical protein
MQNGKELWISQIYFLMENLVDRVHGTWTGRCGSSLSWTEAAQTRGRGGALPVRRARVLGLTGANRRWWWRTSRTRRCWRGAHRSMSGGEEAVRRRQRTATVLARREGEDARELGRQGKKGR